jgi:hypothetical protein
MLEAIVIYPCFLFSAPSVSTHLLFIVPSFIASPFLGQRTKMTTFYTHQLHLSLLFLLPLVAATCYYPNGTAVDDPSFQPCAATSGAVSMCCATNRASQADECLANGLCHNPCVSADLCGGSTGGKYWRESCTDSSWESEFCLNQLCTDPSEGGGKANDNVVVSQCSTDGSWCCGHMTSEICCRINNRVSLAATVGIPSSSMSSATSNPTSGQARGTSTTSISTNSAISGSSSPTPTVIPSSNGQKTGIGVGVGVGVTIVAAIIAFFLWWRRRRRGEPPCTDQVSHEEYHGHVNQNGFVKAELDTVHEINQHRLVRAELAGHDVN